MQRQDNTVGSRLNNDLAYIAGFLDGDGSIMLQIKKRKDGNVSGRRFMATICFYQDARHATPLEWIRKVLGIGYMSYRNDGMAELRINGFKQTEEILLKLLPFIKFKKLQAAEIVKAVRILQKDVRTENDLRKVAAAMIRIQSVNYATRKKKTLEEILIMLGLTP
jgi:hypothetical protein